MREYQNSDGSITNQCLECPTADGCIECGDNVCQTCSPGYFVQDGRCYQCDAFQHGCLECESSSTCKVCSKELGYIFDPELKQCICDTNEGFTWNAEKRQCECAQGTHHLAYTDDLKGIYNFEKSCARCIELFAVCHQCQSSPVYQQGSRKFYEAITFKDNFFKCTQCYDGFAYSNDFQNCFPCHGIHDPACSRCSPDRCEQCEDGYLLINGRCVLCAAKYENCWRCNEARCTQCLDGFGFFFDACWKNII